MKVSELVKKKKKQNIKRECKAKLQQVILPSNSIEQKRISIDGIEYHIVDKEPIGANNCNYQYIYFNGHRYIKANNLYLNIDTRIIKIKDDSEVFGLKEDCTIFNVKTREMYRIKNGFRINEECVKDNSIFNGDVVLKDNRLYKVYAGEPTLIIARIYDNIKQAKGSKEKFVYIRTLGAFFENRNNYFINLDSKDIILFNNISPLPIMHNVVYKGNRYIVYDNKDNRAVLALVGSKIDNGITFEDGSFYFYIDGTKYLIEHLKGFEDYSFRYSKINKGNYIVNDDIVLSSNDFNDYDEVNLYKPNEGLINIKSDIPIFFNQTKISINKARVFISIIYFNERFYMKEYKCLNQN